MTQAYSEKVLAKQLSSKKTYPVRTLLVSILDLLVLGKIIGLAPILLGTKNFFKLYCIYYLFVVSFIDARS